MTELYEEHRSQTLDEPERNSVILEDWLAGLDWTAKLGCCFFHALLTSKSKRLKEVGTNMMRQFDVDIIETSGMTASEDFYIRELYLMFAEHRVSQEAIHLLEHGK